MKSYLAFVFSVGLLIARSGAQVTSTPATPVLTPPTPAISVSTPLAAGTNALAPVPATSPAVKNILTSMSALSTALVVLQTNVLDTLPLLTFFNDNYEFGENFAPAYVPPPGNMSANTAISYGVNLGVNTAVSTGGSLFNAPVVKTPVVPGGVTTVPALASVPVSRDTVSRDTLRALVILQNDLERLLPLLDSLNGGAANSTGLFTNAFGFVRANP